MLTLNTFKFISKLHHSKRNVSKSNELSLKMINLYYLLMPNYIYILKCSFMSSNHYQPWFFFYSTEICEDPIISKYTMCPMCDQECSYWHLSDSCTYSRVSYLFDNPATVAFAIIMALWGKANNEHGNVYFVCFATRNI